MYLYGIELFKENLFYTFRFNKLAQKVFLNNLFSGYLSQFRFLWSYALNVYNVKLGHVSKLLCTLQDYIHPLEISLYLINEKDYIPWAAANTVLNYLDIVLSGSEVYNLFQVGWVCIEIVCWRTEANDFLKYYL